MELEKYMEKKNIVSNVMKGIFTISSDLKLSKLCEKIENNIEYLERENFNLVVIGEFSRGKSTFINALLGKKILPSSKQPTTNIINKIVYGEMPVYKVIYKDGTCKELSEDQFIDIRAQNEKNIASRTLENLKDKFSAETEFVDPDKVSYAEISYPLKFCKNSVVVIDTPGTNDLNVGRMEITYNYLKKAEAAILILSATQPLTASEKYFLKEQVLGNSIKDIFLVINYKDAIKTNDEENVKKHILENLADIADFSERIFLVSSKQALLYRRNDSGERLSPRQMLEVPMSLEETGFIDFEEALVDFLENEKARTKLQKYIGVSNSHLDEILACLKDKSQFINNDSHELCDRLSEQRPKFERVKRETMYITNSMQRKLDNEKLLLEDIELEMEREIKEAVKNVASGYKTGTSNEDFNYQINSVVNPIQKKYIEKFNKFQNDTTGKVSSEALDKLKRIWADMDCKQQTFPIKKANFLEVNIDKDCSGDSEEEQNAKMNGLGVGLLGCFFLGPLGLLLGFGAYLLSRGGSHSFINKEKVINKVTKTYEEELVKFREDIISQYDKSTRYLCTSMQQEIESKLDEMDKQLTLLIEEKQRKDYDVEVEKGKIEKQIQKVYALREKLSEVL